MGKSCLTEISQLMCATGGKITVIQHGQTSELSKQNIKNADPREMHVNNPIVNFEEFQDSFNDDDEYE
ncbi:Uncharacterised protein [Chryseobacterium taklimakanense]|uniref:Uncharacterized protein n=2 Tax=Chryseobacterium taklimakanense TaxID=536441 RepID=A0A239WDE9_9FLAO|nr:Uncharacterised protein [Chryseobacterium taklimakanense]